MRKLKLHKLPRIWFAKPLHYVSSSLGKGISPGGAIFPIRFLNWFDLEQRFIILKPKCWIKKRDGAYFICLDGMCSTVREDMISKIDRVEQLACPPARPLKNLTKINFGISAEFAEAFNVEVLQPHKHQNRIIRIRANLGTLHIIRPQGPDTTISTIHHELLAKTKYATKLTKSILTFYDRVAPDTRCNLLFFQLFRRVYPDQV